MLREVTSNELEILLEFVVPIMSNPLTDCYPKRTVESIRRSLESSIQHPDDQLMVCTLKGTMVGVINLQVITEEKYIQGKGVYICDQYAEVMEELIEYLKQNYRGYTVFLGYPNDNKEAVEFFESRGIACIESSYDMRLDTKNVVFEDRKDNHTTKQVQFSKLSIQQFEEYAVFHDQYTGEIYWNSTRLKEKFSEWFIYICQIDTRIVGSIFINEQTNEMIEVFGMLVEDKYIGCGIEQILLQGALKNLLTKDSAYTIVVYFIEEGYDYQLIGAKEAGFKLNDHYKCFKVEL